MKRMWRALALFGLFGRTATGAIHYVDLNSPKPVPPFTNWATAASTIQDAVDVAAESDEILVTNGVYRAGGRFGAGMTNRLVITNSLVIRSASGPDATAIEGLQPISRDGSDSVRCAYLAASAMLIGFTLTNGSAKSAVAPSAEAAGGGVFSSAASAILSNCT